ncbi:hypothetical protein ASE95_15990 [Sphingomonas sp. Leaf231]|nr:hypothetical protein ASE95_15990 [Sphingomonas sp. Leaf231]
MDIKPFQYGRSFPHRRNDAAGALTDDLLAQVTGLRTELDEQRRAAETNTIEAQRHGFEQGLAQGREEAGAALLAAVDALHAGLEDLDGRLSDHVRVIAREAAETALTAADLLAGFAVVAAPARAVEEALRRVIGDLARGTTIVIHVHPSMLDALTSRLAALATSDRRKPTITLASDEGIPRGDGRIDWGGGGVAIDAGMRRAHVLGELEPFLPTAGQASDEEEADEDKVADEENPANDNVL